MASAMTHVIRRVASSLGVTVAGSSPLAAFRLPVLASAFATVAGDCKYAKSHEWVKVDGDIATVGVSDFAQSELGDVVFAEVPEPGDDVSAGSTFGVLESTKAASDVYSPVSGTVTEVNEALSDTPSLVNESPFADGWMMKVKMSDPSELDSLMDAAEYEKTTE